MRRFDTRERSDVPTRPGHRVVFGRGREADVASLLADAGAQRVLLVAMADHRAGADRVAAALGPRAAGVFTTDRPQVPKAIADAAVAMARQTRADWVVAHGGGTATGLAKAVALELDVAVGAVPTTYAGSERTDVWGLLDGDHKTTGRDERVRPRLVVYDPELLDALRREVTLESLLNAMAHAVEALYAADAEPHARPAAARALAPLWRAFQALAVDPSNVAARDDALYGAYLASEALGGASMALHHKLAHVLGGSSGSPHATIHGLTLPYTMAFNAADPPVAAALSEAFGHADPPAGLWDARRAAGLATGGKALGLDGEAITGVVERALVEPYPNPRPVTATALRALLEGVVHDRRPSWRTRRVVLSARGLALGPHAGLRASHRGTPLDRARAVLLAIHGRGGSADEQLASFERALGPLPDGLALLAPQAAGMTWYPHGFAAERATNEPHLTGAIAAVHAAWELATAHVPPSRVVVAGSSQGACLALTWARERDVRPAALLADSGASSPGPGDWQALAGVPVHLCKSDHDRLVPDAAWQADVASLRACGAEVTACRIPRAAHDLGAGALRRAVAAALSGGAAPEGAPR